MAVTKTRANGLLTAVWALTWTGCCWMGPGEVDVLRLGAVNLTSTGNSEYHWLSVRTAECFHPDDDPDCRLLGEHVQRLHLTLCWSCKLASPPAMTPGHCQHRSVSAMIGEGGKQTGLRRQSHGRSRKLQTPAATRGGLSVSRG